jgi:MFS family permease
MIVIYGLSNILSIFINFKISSAVGRRKTLILIMLILFFFELNLASTSNKDTMNIYGFVFYGVFAAVSAYSLNMINCEYFPAQIRGIGVIFVSMFGTIGKISMLQLALFHEERYMFYVQTVVSLIGVASIILLKETANIPPL